jgi:hypothetical protein
VNAVLFDPAEPGALVRAVKRLCEDEALRSRIAQGARDTITRRGLTWDNNALRVVQLFRALRSSLDHPTQAATEGLAPGKPQFVRTEAVRVAETHESRRETCR